MSIDLLQFLANKNKKSPRGYATCYIILPDKIGVYTDGFFMVKCPVSTDKEGLYHSNGLESYLTYPSNVMAVWFKEEDIVNTITDEKILTLWYEFIKDWGANSKTAIYYTQDGDIEFKNTDSNKGLSLLAKPVLKSKHVKFLEKIEVYKDGVVLHCNGGVEVLLLNKA